MKSPDVPIAKKGFFVTHFLTVKDQAKSKEFYVGILGGKVVGRKIRATSSWKTPGLFSTRAEGPRRTSQK
jgi:catechol 2,3-dioxygenase-like lactoylglutathione lyase family enzyme